VLWALHSKTGHQGKSKQAGYRMHYVHIALRASVQHFMLTVQMHSSDTEVLFLFFFIGCGEWAL